MGGKSTPPAPDYAGAAREQAKSSREVTEQQTWANRPDQITPFGTQSWQANADVDPSTGKVFNRWTQTTNVAPELQGALQDQFRVISARSKLGADMTNRLQTEMGTPMDWSKFRPSGQSVAAPEYGDLGQFRQKQEDALYNRAKSRLDPMWEQRERQRRAQLYNMGLRDNDAAFTEAMGNMGRDRNDAYNQATFSAIQGGGAEMANQINMGGATQQQAMASSGYQNQLRQQDIAEELQRRGASLNEINAALMGQQVAMPSMPQFNTAAAAQPIQALGAAQMQGQADLDRYNARQAATQGMMAGIGSMAGGFMGMG